MNIEVCSNEYERKLNWNDAMMYCSLLVIDGKNDWRLPTREELNDIYHSENDFTYSGYWSSLDEGNLAWLQNMSSGNQFDTTKNYSLYVRAVRSI